jgi:hypothetical protein
MREVLEKYALRRGKVRAEQNVASGLFGKRV